MAGSVPDLYSVSVVRRPSLPSLCQGIQEQRASRPRGRPLQEDVPRQGENPLRSDFAVPSPLLTRAFSECEIVSTKHLALGSCCRMVVCDDRGENPRSVEPPRQRMNRHDDEGHAHGRDCPGWHEQEYRQGDPEALTSQVV